MNFYFLLSRFYYFVATMHTADVGAAMHTMMMSTPSGIMPTRRQATSDGRKGHEALNLLLSAFVACLEFVLERQYRTNIICR